MPRLKRLLLWPLIILVLLLGYLLLWPVAITPIAWTPPAAPPLTGQYQRNNKLATTTRIALGQGFAPEDVAIDSAGRIYAGLVDGRIVRVQADGRNPEDFVNTHGRPLGLIF